MNRKLPSVIQRTCQPLRWICGLLVLLLFMMRCTSVSNEITLNDLPIRKLVLNDFLSEQQHKEIPILRYDSDTGEIMDFKFDSVKQIIMMDTCQHHLNRGREEYARRTVNLALINYRINSIKGSGYALNFLDDTLISIRLNNVEMKDELLKRYFHTPKIDTIVAYTQNQDCPNGAVTRKLEIRYTEGDLGMEYNFFEYPYGNEHGDCALARTVTTDLYSISGKKTKTEIYRRKV